MTANILTLPASLCFDVIAFRALFGAAVSMQRSSTSPLLNNRIGPQWIGSFRDAVIPILARVVAQFIFCLFLIAGLAVSAPVSAADICAAESRDLTFQGAAPEVKHQIQNYRTYVCKRDG